MIFVATDILNPYKREILSSDNYPSLIDFLIDKFPNGFSRPTDISVNGHEIKVDDYDVALQEDDVVVLLDRASLPVGLIGGWFITALANLAISVTLSYVANKLFAPDSPSEQPQPSSVYNLNSAQNIARFGSPIPIIYGKVRAFPSMIVQPYYKFEDNIEYLYHVLCVGQGTLITDDVLIGDDSISNTGDFDWRLLYKNSFYNIPLNAYGVHITKTLSVPSTLELKTINGGVGTESEKYTISSESSKIEFDYMYPRGLFYVNSDGDYVQTSSNFKVRLYVLSSGVYTEVYSQIFTNTAVTVDAIQSTYAIDISGYTEDVHISFQKIYDYPHPRDTHDLYIKRVKEIYPNEDFTQRYGDITLLACKIKATNAVSSAGQVKVNGYFERTDVGNRIHEVLTDLYTNTNYGAGLSASDLSFPFTKERVDCAYDSNITVFDAMRKPALAQGYSLYLAGMDVILKKDGVNAITSGMYNEMNISRNSFKAQYLFKEEYPAYDGFKCTYIEAKGWVQRSETYPALSTRPNTVDLFGVIDWTSYYNYHLFDMIILSPLEPGINNVSGLPETNITVESIGPGVWRAYSDIPITYARFGTNKTSVTSVSVNNVTTITSADSMFQGMTAMTSVNLAGLDTSLVTEMSSMFSSCSSLTSIDCSDFDTSNVTTMSSMFDSTTSLVSVKMTNFDTTLVTSMARMFNSSGILELNFASFTFGAADMTRMFADAQQLTCISNINTLNATTTSLMFLRNYALVSPDAEDQNSIMNIRADWVGSTSCGL